MSEEGPSTLDKAEKMNEYLYILAVAVFVISQRHPEDIHAPVKNNQAALTHRRFVSSLASQNLLRNYRARYRSSTNAITRERFDTPVYSVFNDGN